LREKRKQKEKEIAEEKAKKEEAENIDPKNFIRTLHLFFSLAYVFINLVLEEHIAIYYI
jgi:hypothetical protein